jgi:hypothetical protein
MGYSGANSESLHALQSNSCSSVRGDAYINERMIEAFYLKEIKKSKGTVVIR